MLLSCGRRPGRLPPSGVAQPSSTTGISGLMWVRPSRLMNGSMVVDFGAAGSGFLSSFGT